MIIERGNRTKSVILVIAGVLILGLSSTNAQAGKDYNPSKSNTRAISKLKDMGVDEAGRERILDAFNDELQAYKNYNSSISNAITAMEKEGLRPDEVKGILDKIGIVRDVASQGTTVTTRRGYGVTHLKDVCQAKRLPYT